MGICNPTNKRKTIKNISSIKTKKLKMNNIASTTKIKIPKNDNRYTIKKIKDLDGYYIENNNNNKYVIIYHPDDYDLPLQGWIHYCMLCDTRTSRIHKHTIINNKEIYFQMCNTCWRTKFLYKKSLDCDLIISKINLSQ